MTKFVSKTSISLRVSRVWLASILDESLTKRLAGNCGFEVQS